MMELPLTQFWLPEIEPGFQPGQAKFLWKDGILEVTANLNDCNVHTTATSHGQRLWEHGDVAELFVQRIGDESYREYQISPNGFTLALAYPDLGGVAGVRSGSHKVEDFFAEAPFRAFAELTPTGWTACFSIPVEGFPGERIRVSCCRYDVAEGRPPIISSTSPHPVRDFHRPQEWREFVLEGTSG